MPTLRIALAQVNPTVGDLTGNAGIVRSTTRAARDAGARLVVFPEMMLTGYPVEDLVFRQSFVAASRAALERLAADLDGDGLGDTPVAVGFLDADGPPAVNSPTDPSAGARNALAVLHRGRVVARYFKHHLPNYGVFDEDRYFVPGNTLVVVRIDGIDVALTICEDMWQVGGPFAAARRAGVGLVLTVNGSPFELHKDDTRLALVRRRAAEADATIAYLNMVGGQDELVFDGDSMIVAPGGEVLARAPQLAEHLLIHDLDLPLGLLPPPPSTPALAAHSKAELVGDEMGIERVHVSDPHPALPATPLQGGLAGRLSDEAEVWNALVLGLGDYVRKNGFRQVALGLSGGIDSSVVAAIAVDAIGPDAVIGVSMPSQHSSAHSREDAAELAKRTGLEYRVHEIQPMVDTFLTGMSLSGLALENLQARVRGVILMSISNQEGPLVLTTGNKSELAVGYSTLYGDSVGGFNPLKDVPKTLVWKLARWRNDEALRTGEEPPIPERSIEKPPSAELRPGQLDSDSLPDYDELDSMLLSYVDGDQGRADLVAAGHEPEVVDRVLHLVDLAEYKRRQSAPGTKISIKAFGRDRRLPITNRWRETG
ncbi:NAD+ synthase (glutamine-hydrolysing) [Asanoa ferruginea]|uniref:Glutamine-dependent NAD(+) synthetase n=1 Tax=Asanoa ferruginea TaxID=53367 RepID=A0A3E0A048_9ACTN|nr:NAD+ synthase [Asanoa ferruginea]REG02283.1 NAD+ synthase (glutamine-hydrolysing) [Asanoa ferruginea]GIF46520.1 NAD+ synthase (glutamine-hydrolysing) [Asanoa ferruginea]